MRSRRAGALGNPWPRPGPEGPPRICPQPAGPGSVPHVGVSKDLRVLVILWRCGCLVALSRVHVFSPQGRVGTAHHLAVGGGPWEDDVISSLGLEERACGLTAGFCQRRWAHTLLPAGLSLPAPPPLQAPVSGWDDDLPRRGRPLTSSSLSHPAEGQASPGDALGVSLSWPFKEPLLSP